MPDTSAGPRLLLVGNSHTQAVKAALAARAAAGRPTHGAEVLWLRTERHGDATLEEAEAAAARLGPDDLLVLSRLGTRHHAFGVFRMEPPFSVVDRETGRNRGPADWEIVPVAVMAQAMALPRRNGSAEARLRRATTTRILHLAPPPTRRGHGVAGKLKAALDEEPVLRLYNDPFARLAIWKAEMAVLEDHLRHHGIDLLPPPEGCRDEDGFLAPAFEASDDTHANAAYGELVLRQLESLLGSPDAPSPELAPPDAAPPDAAPPDAA